MIDHLLIGLIVAVVASLVGVGIGFALRHFCQALRWW